MCLCSCLCLSACVRESKREGEGEREIEREKQRDRETMRRACSGSASRPPSLSQDLSVHSIQLLHYAAFCARLGRGGACIECAMKDAELEKLLNCLHFVSN